MSRLFPVSYRGVAYRTLVDLTRALGRKGDTDLIRNRIQKMGSTVEQAVEVPKARPFHPEGIVYLITQISTGKRYVGVTTNTMMGRWAHHVFNAKRGLSPLACAVAQDGPDGFTHLELESNVPSALLAQRERFWIERLGTLRPHGLNAINGGAIGGRNTARRWVREGKVGGAARRYQSHGGTKHPLFKRWHGMRCKAGVCSAWEDFDRWLVEAAPILTANNMVRINPKEPWSPTNMRRRKGD